MYMTDARGLRYQALWIVALLPVNLGLSWILAVQIGAAGPIIGSAVGVLVCQVMANWIYVRRDLARRSMAAVAEQERSAHLLAEVEADPEAQPS
jgi:O-antigen/teichoic acid export membrane protein